MRLCIALLALTGAALPWDPKENDPPKDFTRRLDDYVKLRKKVVKPAADLKDKEDAALIDARKRAAAEAIRKARSGAAQGDIFTPAAQHHIRQIIRSEMKGAASRPVRATVKQGNPTEEGKPFAPKVNAAYPEDAPLSSVPPTMLARLPELPKELEYRFVGRHLILHDIESRLIVDFIPNALP